MKILVFASCSKTKVIKYPNQPTCNEITSKESLRQYQKSIPEKRKAADLYRGSLNISINSAIKQLREIFEVSYYIVSAGFGIVNENDEIPPYECSFVNMNKKEIKERAEFLQIQDDYQKIIQRENPEFIYLALGKDYLFSLGDWDSNLPCKTIAFNESNSDKVITLPANHIAVKEASKMSGLPIHGIVGYKGDLLLLTTRYLKNKDDPVQALKDILNDPDGLVYTINTIRENMI